MGAFLMLICYETVIAIYVLDKNIWNVHGLFETIGENALTIGHLRWYRLEIQKKAL